MAPEPTTSRLTVQRGSNECRAAATVAIPDPTIQEDILAVDAKCEENRGNYEDSCTASCASSLPTQTSIL